MQYPKRRGICYDPIEDTEVYKEAMRKIEKELDELMEGRDGMGSSHVYWSFKKKLLAKLGIEWESPSECNPHIMFD